MISTAVFTLIDLLQNGPKDNNLLGYFWERICCQELSKMVQSGHTGTCKLETSMIILDLPTYL